MISQEHLTYILIVEAIIVLTMVLLLMVFSFGIAVVGMIAEVLS